MITSRDRILTTHVGSLPRSDVLSRPAGQARGRRGLRQGASSTPRWTRPCATWWRSRRRAGIDIGNDGEQQRVGFQTYVPQRMSGFGGVSKRRRGREFEEFPELVNYLKRRFPQRQQAAERAGVPGRAQLPRHRAARERDRAASRASSRATGAFSECFMTAPSPGIISSTMLNAHYASHEAYLEAHRARDAERVPGDPPGGAAAADRCARPRHGPHHALPRSLRRSVRQGGASCTSP